MYGSFEDPIRTVSLRPWRCNSIRTWQGWIPREGGGDLVVAVGIARGWGVIETQRRTRRKGRRRRRVS
jgi:hypothetical protein